LDRFTEQLLNRLDKDVKKRFGVSLTSVLAEPSAYMNQKGFAVKLSRITDYVDKQTERMIDQAKGSSKAFHESAARANELTRKVENYISSHARQNGVPVIKPASVELPAADKNRFYISEMDDSTTRFIERLVDSSAFVVDMTKSYDNLKMGSWLFGGDRECIVGVHAPRNSMLLLRSGRAEILDMLQEAADSVKGL
jgi:hypothetical protein